MHDLEIDRALSRIAPVVKFMHGYFGTCVSGLKMHGFPHAVACDRRLGPACLALYVPRRCGQIGARLIWDQWRWARNQRDLFGDYAAIVVASDHMRDEYVRHGADPATLVVDHLFSTIVPAADIQAAPAVPHVVFLGRMTALKGGDLLIRAVRRAARRAGRTIALTLVGDGPQRAEWEALARRIDVPCRFTGWLTGSELATVLASASVAALPSVWPEPFGLAGLDAGALGVPTIAADVGGIRDWLRDGENGVLLAAPPTAEQFGDAIAGLLIDEPRLSALRAGALRAARAFTPERHVVRLEAVLTRAQDSRCVFS
jgi:glycosyltransferase involved in cell wall biosynthesis